MKPRNEEEKEKEEEICSRNVSRIQTNSLMNSTDDEHAHTTVTTNANAEDDREMIARRARERNIVWARVKGHQWWPSQIVDLRRTKENVPENVLRRCQEGVSALQFFSTKEYSWFRNKNESTDLNGVNVQEKKKKKKKKNNGGSQIGFVEVIDFESGVNKGFAENKKTKGVLKAIEETFECLRSGRDPEVWHTQANWAALDDDDDDDDDGGKRATKTKEQKKGTVAKKKNVGKAAVVAKGKAEAGVKVENKTNVEEEKKPQQIKTKDEEELTLVSTFKNVKIEAKSFELSYDIMSARDPPTFERLRRNRWICRPAPKPVHKEEIVSCNCRPVLFSMKGSHRQEQQQERGGFETITTERAMKLTSCTLIKTNNVLPRKNGEVGSLLVEEENGPSTPPDDDATHVRDSSIETETTLTITPPSSSEEDEKHDGDGEQPKRGTSAASAVKKKQQKLRLACGQDCENRATRYTCDSRACPCGDECSNRPFNQLPTPKVKVQLTENRGYGLFLQQDVLAGDFIVEYMGEIVDDEECSRRLLACKGKNEPNFYLMEITPSQIIDARFCGNNARFINSSCNPNCETQRWVDASNEETRVGIFATENIKAGTELTYDYNFAHFGGEGTTSFTCFCGHPLCKGTLDANPERMRRFMERVRVTTKNGKKVAGTVLEYTVSKKYKILLDDPGDFKNITDERTKAAHAVKKTKRRYLSAYLDTDGMDNLPHVWLTNVNPPKEINKALVDIGGDGLKKKNEDDAKEKKKKTTKKRKAVTAATTTITSKAITTKTTAATAKTAAVQVKIPSPAKKRKADDDDDDATKTTKKAATKAKTATITTTSTTTTTKVMKTPVPAVKKRRRFSISTNTLTFNEQLKIALDISLREANELKMKKRREEREIKTPTPSPPPETIAATNEVEAIAVAPPIPQLPQHQSLFGSMLGAFSKAVTDRLTPSKAVATAIDAAPTTATVNAIVE